MEPKPRKQTAPKQAEPWASAAFQIAKEDSAVGEWEEKLNLLSELVKHPDIERILRHPQLRPEDIQEIMKPVYDKLELGEAQRVFVDEMIDAKKMSLLPWVFEKYVKLRKKDEGMEDVVITSAEPLTYAQQENLSTRLRDKFNIRAIPEFRVDESLIAGVKIQIGDMVIDQTAKGYQSRKPKPPGSARR